MQSTTECEYNVNDTDPYYDLPPKVRTIMAIAGSYITLRDYQTSPSLTCPTAHPLKRIKAVKGKEMAESY